MSNIGSMKGQSCANYQLAGVGENTEGLKIQEYSFAEAEIIGKIITGFEVNHHDPCVSLSNRVDPISCFTVGTFTCNVALLGAPLVRK